MRALFDATEFGPYLFSHAGIQAAPMTAKYQQVQRVVGAAIETRAARRPAGRHTIAANMDEFGNACRPPRAAASTRKSDCGAPGSHGR